MASGEQLGSSIYHALGVDAVGIYNFDDGTPRDSRGNDHDGSLMGGASINEDSGKFRQGLSLDGSGQYLELPETTFFSGDIDEVRIYPKDLGSAQIQKHYAAGLEKRGTVLK